MKTYKCAQHNDWGSSRPTTVFVGGPIQYALSNGLFDASLRRMLECVLSVLDKEGFKVLSAHLVEEFGAMDMTGLAPRVAQRDYEWMEQADVYVCLLPSNGSGVPYRSDGTCIELGWASAMRKRIVVVRSPEVSYTHLIDGLHSIAHVTYLDAHSVVTEPSILIGALRMAERPHDLP